MNNTYLIKFDPKVRGLYVVNSNGELNIKTLNSKVEQQHLMGFYSMHTDSEMERVQNVRELGRQNGQQDYEIILDLC